MIQLQVFPGLSGYYVLKKIPATWISDCCALFDSSGKLLHAECRLLGIGTITTIRPGSNRWTTLQRIGRRYVGLAAKRVEAELKRVAEQQKKARG